MVSNLILKIQINNSINLSITQEESIKYLSYLMVLHSCVFTENKKLQPVTIGVTLTQKSYKSHQDL